MEEQVSIVKNRNNTLEFEVEVSGVRTDNMDVRFVIKDNDGLQYTFNAAVTENNIWEVSIPKSTPLLKTSYNFEIEVVVEHYLFTPYSGTLSILEKPTVNKKDDVPIVPKVSGVKSNTDDNNEKKFIVDTPAKFNKKKASEPQTNNKKPAESSDIIKRKKEKTKKLREDKIKKALEDFNNSKKKIKDNLVEPEVVEDSHVDDVELPPSLLNAAIDHLNRGSKLSEQAKKVQDIVKSFKK